MVLENEKREKVGKYVSNQRMTFSFLLIDSVCRTLKEDGE